ncbi:hypothetical protein [Rehaibacterium terrae]|jgi:hypothetical protein|uniref:Uncharacterized protein n=1 Tax=Rehaibacterium terrae TaxID=1341696 RepID=A0A7W8DFM4_9GAMM|nr:hypothetical protein [Rehaibacterium terrae]MBB5016531.1 hypothetical protein [Rehaibacterium terrae]
MSKYPLCFTGMEQADEATLKMLFVDANASLGEPFELTSEDRAQILVVDLGSIYGHMTWLRAHSAGKTVVGLSNRADSEADFTLLRPVSESSLRDILAAVAAAQTGAANEPLDGIADGGTASAAARDDADEPTASAAPMAGTTDAVETVETVETADAADPETETDGSTAIAAQTPEAAEQPAPEPPREKHLVDYLRAGALPGPMRLQLPDAPPLVVDPRTGHYFGPPQLKPLMPYCRIVIAPEQWVPASAEDAARAGSPQPWTRLIWLCGLVSGAGRLVDAGDGERQYRLLKWPQIEREFPRHFRIATAMMKGPATLPEIAQASSATVEEVADFVNASLATGFAAIELPPSVEPEAPAKGGLLGRLKGLRGG